MFKNYITKTLSRIAFNYLQTQKRGYNSGALNRLTHSFIGTYLKADDVIKWALKTMRARSRDLAINNPFAKRFIELYAINIVGHNGCTFTSTVLDQNGRFDVGANKILENAWWDWAKQTNWVQIQNLIIKTLARDGEVLVKMVRGKTVKNKYKFKLQVLEADYLDEMFTDESRNIYCGIEYDDNQEPIAYHIYEKHPGGMTYTGNKRIRVPAKDIIHLYNQDRPSQSRGVPPLHAVMVSLNHIQKFSEASLTASIIAASKMGFITQAESDVHNINGNNDDYTITAEPGSIEILQPGQNFQTFDPNFPNIVYSDFVKAQLREVAAGLGVSYAAITGDYTDTNFSSLRQSEIHARSGWKYLQSYFISNLCERVYAEWLEMFLMLGLSSLPLSKFDKFNAPQFRARSWEYVNPAQDVNASATAISKGLSSLTKELGERGLDIEDLAAEIARENEVLKKYGLEYLIPQIKPTTAAQVNA